MLQVWYQGSLKQYMYQECHKRAMIHGQDEDVRCAADAMRF